MEEGNSCAATYLGRERVSRRVSFSFSKWSKVFAESRFPRDELWALAPDDEHPFRLFLSLVVSMRNTPRRRKYFRKFVSFSRSLSDLIASKFGKFYGESCLLEVGIFFEMRNCLAH